MNLQSTAKMRARAPKAIQSDLEGLEREVALLRARLGEGDNETDTYVRNGLGRPHTPLPRGARVIFMGKEGDVEVKLTTEGRLDVSTDGHLRVYPASSNRVEVVGGFDL